MMQVTFSKIELEISPFLAVIQFYTSNTVEKEPTRNFNAANFQKYTYLPYRDKIKPKWDCSRYRKHIGLYLRD